MTKLRVLGTLLALGTLLTFALCTLTEAREEQREEFHQTYPLAAKGRVSLKNINGDVRITAWDRNEVKIDAIKHARTAERLADIAIKIDAAPESIRIKTEYPENRFHNDPGGVDYALTVPRTASLDTIELVNGGLDIQSVAGDVRASSVNGHVRARWLSGEVKISTVNGLLEATFEPKERQSISLDTVNGSLVLALPPDASADLRASTVNGGISNDFGLPVHRDGFIGHNLEGVLGSGGAHITLSDVNGSIKIHRGSDAAN